MNTLLVVGVLLFVGGMLLLVTGMVWGVILVIIGGVLARTGSKGYITDQLRKSQAGAKTPKK